MNVNSLRLYLSTVSHLRPEQLFYLARQRLLSGGRVRFCKDWEVALRHGVSLGETLTPVGGAQGDYSFCFLNVSRSFPDGRIDWACRDMPKLWRYNLHYFDYLQDPGRSGDALGNLVSSWIESNPPGNEDAWEPYTVSLRIVNWIKWFLKGGAGLPLPRAWLESLYMQAAWLERNIERHLLANHYLKNAKALLFAGAYFAGVDADRWLSSGWKILLEEACEQILADGGHHERSPMYHCIVVEDYLDVLNLVLTNPALVSTDNVKVLRERCIAAVAFLDAVLAPDGQIPLFNDSAYGIAPTAQQLFGYAGWLVDYKRPEPEAGLRVSTAPDSGYFVMRDGNDMLIVDCGLIGPDYQPGHAHCDTLSYELCLGGRRIVVDAGVHDYENSEDRHYARSTRAHNTVVVDGQEQSEIWGVFRVARRAKPLGARLDQLDNHSARFEGAHDGYQRLQGKVTHRRAIEYRRSEGWRVRDTLTGEGVHRVESFIHLAPDLLVSEMSDEASITVTDYSGKTVAHIALPDNLQAEIVEGMHFPEFGVRSLNRVVRLSGDVELPFDTAYRISGAGFNNNPINR